MAKAIIYARVSTARQAEDELPLQSQVEQCERKAAELGATVVRQFVDSGISGATDTRPAFRDAIVYCETFSPDFLITWSTSRFARNRVDAGLYKKRVEKPVPGCFTSPRISIRVPTAAGCWKASWKSSTSTTAARSPRTQSDR